MISEGERHRRVVPEDESRHTRLGDQIVDGPALSLYGEVLGRSRRQMWSRDDDVAVALQFEAIRAGRVVNRFFDEEHAALARAARQKLLRALKYEFPAQMREADDVVRGNRVLRQVHGCATSPRTVPRSYMGRQSPRQPNDPWSTGPLSINAADLGSDVRCGLLLRRDDDTAAKPAAGHAGTEDAGLLQCDVDQQIDLRRRDLVVVPHRDVRLGEQAAETPQIIRAQRLDGLQHTRVL